MSIQNSISSIMNKFASSNRFTVQLGNDSTGNDYISKDNNMVKSVQLPEKEITITEFFYDGVKYPLAREDMFKNTTEITFYMDDSGQREKFIKWMETLIEINTGNKNVDNLKWYTTMTITHYKNNSDKPIRTYTLTQVFPTEVSSVTLSSDSNAILEYTVNFAFAQWSSKEGD